MDKTLPAGISFASLSDAQSLRPDITPAIAALHLVKRGDFITILLKWKPQPTKFIDKNGNEAVHEWPANAMQTETLACLVSQVAPNGLIRARVTSSPSETAIHTVTHGDDLAITEPYVLRHESTPGNKLAGLEHLLTDIAPIPPIVGKKYWTRDGGEATIWTELTSGEGNYLLGEVSWAAGVGREGLRDVQWLKDGRNRQGMTRLDIVRDPDVRMVEVA
jgi:hypothetical protein